MPIRVAVVGAGALGLMAMKNFKEDGFEVTGYESRDYVGGLWKDSNDASISVHSTTTFNSSKYRAAISDFPFPEDTDDFPTALQLHRYLEDHCDHFDLRPLIQFRTQVIGLSRVSTQWALEVVPPGGTPRVDYFDKVALATGSFVIPRRPSIEGMELFQGRVLHSIDYHGSAPFEGQNVLLVGLHATGQDVTVSLSENATKVYLSHRSGLVLLRRYSTDGATYDQTGSLAFIFIQVFILTWFPRFWDWLLDRLLNSLSKSYFPDLRPEWKLRPAPSSAVCPPLTADGLYSALSSGFAEPVGPVSQVTGAKTVQLADGRILSDIDTIIYCTGYDFDVPFTPKEYNPYPVVGEPPRLYRNTFPLSPDPEIRNSLVFLGQVGVAFPGFVQHELVAMAVSQIWRSKASLPSLEDMESWYRRYITWRNEIKSRHEAKSTFYTAFVPFVDHIKWLDETAGTGLFSHFGWFSLRAWRLWWEDRELYTKVLYGLFSPSAWRLFDLDRRKPWSQARRQVLLDNEIAMAQRNRRAEWQKQEEDKKKGA